MKITEYHENGYTIANKLVEPTFLDEIVRTIKAPFYKQIEHFGYSSMIDLYEEMPDIFMNCAKHAQWNLQLHHLGVMLGYKVGAFMQREPLINICTRPVIYFNNLKTAKKAVNHTTPAHADSISMKGSEDAVVVWVPLIEMSEEHGFLEIAPKSHILDHSIKKFEDGFGNVDEELFTFEPIKVKKGDVLIFNSNLVHRSGKLQNDKVTRWSAHFRFNNMYDERFITNGYPHPYEYKNIT